MVSVAHVIPQPRRSESATAVGLGDRIRAARVALGLTQAGVADGRVTRTAISRYESGARRPDGDTLAYLAARLDVTVDELLSGPPPQRRRTMEAKLGHAELAFSAGETRNARELARQVIRATRNTVDRDLAGRADLIVALVMESEGDNDGAIRALEALRASAADGPSLAAIGVALSRCYREGSHNELAIAVGEEVSGELQARGLQGLTDSIRLVVSTAAAHFENDNLNQARRLCARAVAAAEQHQSIEGQAIAYWEASILEDAAGMTGEARLFASRALSILQPSGETLQLSILRTQLASYCLDPAEPDLAQAQAHLEQARRELEWSPASPLNEARTLIGLARVQLGYGSPGDAAQLLEALPDGAETQAPYFAAMRSLLAGHIHAFQENPEEAKRSYDVGRDLLALLDDDRNASQLWFELAEGLRAIEELDGALGAYRRAGDLLGAARKRGHREP
ncbi:MAG: helix-turn-helix domain-containing protein [Nocardioides sp.]